jgi:three-Cys-motif partner protein
MKDVIYYRGREQTYLKHFFLEKYLERVSYVVGYSYPEFVYVDGFSGPWRSQSEAFEDTSFIIAINRLRQVRDGLIKAGKNPRIRCLFIEKDPEAFFALEKAIKDVADFEAKPLRGEFENLIPDILRFIGQSFSLTFIDPTGWTGIDLLKIRPILQHRPGEVITNFMFDHINRFLDDPRPEISQSFDELFGGPGWSAAVQAGPRREETILELYLERMRSAGDFNYLTSTRILKPIADRSYFYLLYGTRHVKGLQEFRRVEKQAIGEQERVRVSAKQLERITRTRQQEFFFPSTASEEPSSFDDERDTQLAAATSRLRVMLQAVGKVKYEDVLGSLLEMPLVWESDIQQIVRELRAAEVLDIENFKTRERSVKPGHILLSKKPQ